MKYLIFVVLVTVTVTVGCGPSVTQLGSPYDSSTYRGHCNSLCQEKFHTDVKYVGRFNGDCYCVRKNK